MRTHFRCFWVATGLMGLLTVVLIYYYEETSKLKANHEEQTNLNSELIFSTMKVKDENEVQFISTTVAKTSSDVTEQPHVLKYDELFNYTHIILKFNCFSL